MTRDMVLNKNKIKRHKGYRILAIDGSELRLDKTKENKEMKTLVACADLKATYPAVNWKEGKLLNRASKKELESWLNELH